jgi:hypothetical protein
MSKESLVNKVAVEFEDLSKSLYENLLDDLPNVNFHKLVSDILGDIFDDIDGDI